MKYNHLIGCIIDGAVPHTDMERCQILAGLLAEVTGTERGNEIIESARNCDASDLSFIEKDLIDAIEGALPSPLCLIREAGDVIITTIDQRDA